VRKQYASIVTAFRHGYTVNVVSGSVYGLRKQKLKPQITASGHSVVTLQTPTLGKRKERVISVHALIAYKKFGKKAFVDGVEIRHKNGKPSDNRGQNITYGTRSQNYYDIADADRKARHFKATRHLVGKPNCNRKISDQVVKAIRKAGKIDNSRGRVTRLAKRFGIHYSKILMILSRKAYGSVKD